MVKSRGLLFFLGLAALTTAWLWLRVCERSLAIIGPLLAACGAGLLAYDVIRGGVRAGTRRMFEDSARGIGEMYRRMIQGFRQLPDATHADAKREWIEEAERKLEAVLSGATIDWRQFEDGELADSLRYASWGFILIVIGSLMQSGGAILGK